MGKRMPVVSAKLYGSAVGGGAVGPSAISLDQKQDRAHGGWNQDGDGSCFHGGICVVVFSNSGFSRKRYV